MTRPPTSNVVPKCYNEHCTSPMRYEVTINGPISYLCVSHAIEMALLTIINTGSITLVNTNREL